MRATNWKLPWSPSQVSSFTRLAHRSQEHSLLAIANLLQRIFSMISINSQMKRYTGSGLWGCLVQELCPCGIRACHPPDMWMGTCSQTQRLSELCPFKLLWRLYCSSLSDCIIDLWRSLQHSAPLLSPEAGTGGGHLQLPPGKQNPSKTSAGAEVSTL